ncbi:MAG: hypothetical protein UT28_C0001G0087 [Berkelbacteria bacterium GW2011_GWE1_39_12]|uniref:Uncharacterized protein n=1 Tax=Berkelbacteria bacterium GW2011_GWE1_39_12 TaxID=1618337 RepID=A0A0G4B1S0_9BACT|nr:MAG: hypothetical protein UT28_C0001G0087 [Berkelbacteria bacterium GW2011_GWE1_39_12]
MLSPNMQNYYKPFKFKPQKDLLVVFISWISPSANRLLRSPLNQTSIPYNRMKILVRS